MSTYRVYGTKEEGEKTVDGDNEVVVDRHFGCDGQRHAVSLIRVWMDRKSKEAVYAEHIREYDDGPCDGACGVEDHGFFSYEPTEYELQRTEGTSTS